MSQELPAPLVAPGIDLRDFAFMPLDVRRLLTSETWLEAADDPRLGHALMCLWCESWHQVPAASLPTSDRALARLAMCDPKTWAKLKPRALRDWVECSDGRFYHPVVAEKAIEGWNRKLAQRERTRKATEERERRKRERDEQRNVNRNDGRDDDRDKERDVIRGEQHAPQRDVHQGTETGTENLERKKDAAPAAISNLNGFSPDPKKDFYQRFATVWPAKNSGGMATKLLQAKGNSVAKARAALELASESVNPQEYIGAIVRGRDSESMEALRERGEAW